MFQWSLYDDGAMLKKPGLAAPRPGKHRSIINLIAPRDAYADTLQRLTIVGQPQQDSCRF